MPMYYYQCEACKKTVRRICSPEQSTDLPKCCSGAMVRTPKPPTSRSVETLDNGLMVKRIERLTEAERLFHERADAVQKQQTAHDELIKIK